MRKKSTDPWTTIAQPDEGLGYDWETTYTEDSGRVQSGVNQFKAMFTVEKLSCDITNPTVNEVKQILNFIIYGRKFQLHYFSPSRGEWRNDWFYVGQGNCSLGKLKENEERYDKLSFNMTGINPI